MTSLAFFSIFLLSLVITSRLVEAAPCPFNPNVCNCTGNSPKFSEVLCRAPGLPISFTGSENTYEVDGRMDLYYDAYNIEARAFAIFKSIGELVLTQSETPKPMPAYWRTMAFNGPHIKSLSIVNVANVIPPPMALKEIANTLESIAFVIAINSTLGPKCFSDFTNLKKLVIEQTSPNPNIDATAFNGLENLQELYLSNVSLATVPVALRPLTKLLQLKLRFDNIQNFSPDNFTAFQQLKSLDLSGNNLKTASTSGVLDKIPQSTTTLFLENAQLDSVPSTVISKHPNLTIFTLNDNQIHTLKNGDFPNGNQLAYLYLSGNPIANIESGAFQYLTGVQRLFMYQTNLVSIDLSLFKGMNKFSLYLDNNNLLTSIVVTNPKEVPTTMEISATNSMLQYVDPKVASLLDRPNSTLDISYDKLVCNDSVNWMARYALCSPYNLKLDGTTCTDGVVLKTFLSKKAPNPCPPSTASASTISANVFIVSMVAIVANVIKVIAPK